MKVFNTLIAAGLLVAATAVTAHAGVKVGAGDPAPDFGGKQWFNHDKASLEDMRGQVVFLDIWRTWCGPCTAQIPHLNELNAKYKDQGLKVVGITDESKSLVTKHMDKHSMEFPIVILSPDEEDNYGITGFPTSFLIDADGIIVWRGHPAAFDREFGEKRLEEMLAQTSSFAELPAAYSSVSKLLAKGELGKAWESAGKTLARKEVPELSALQEKLSGMASARLERADALMEEGAFGAAHQIYAGVNEAFAGMPEAEQADVQLDELRGDKQAAADIAAADKYADAVEKWRKGDFEKALKLMEGVVKKYPGTITADRAYEMIDRHES